jgi:AbrB family looped-hinge helix DNA binding protein
MQPGRSRRIAALTSEATVTSKGQITLPKRLREQLGIESGSRIRFLLDGNGGFQGDPVLHDLEELWSLADAGPRRKRALTEGQMNAAKARRQW